MIDNQLNTIERGAIFTKLEGYSSNNPKNFSSAMIEFTNYCDRHLPKISEIIFAPICFCISFNEESLVLGGDYGNVANFDITTDKLMRDEEICYKVPIREILLALDDTLVILSNGDYELFFLEFPSFEILFKIHQSAFPIKIKLNPEKQWLYILNGGNYLTKLELSNDADYYDRIGIENKMIFESEINCIEISQDNSLLAVGVLSGEIIIVSIKADNVLKKTEPYPYKPIIIAFAEFCLMIASAYEDHSIKVWNLNSSLTLRLNLIKHTDMVTGLAFVRENKYLISTSLDYFINVWDIKAESVPHSINILDSKVLQLISSKDHKTVYYLQQTNAVMTWNVPRFPKNSRYKGHTEAINKLLFVPNTSNLISIGDDGLGIIWDYKNDRKIDELAFTGKLTNGIVSRKGNFAVVCSSLPLIYQWTLYNNTKEELLLALPAVCIGLTYNEDILAVAERYDRILLLDYETMEWRLTLKGHTNLISALEFLNDPLCMFTASHDCTLIKWNINTGERIGKCIGHNTPILHMILSQSGWIISASSEGDIIIWNADCFLLYNLTSQEKTINTGLYLSEDHSYLISLQYNKVTYWQLDNLSILFQNDSFTYANILSVNGDEKFIAIAENNIIYIEENALNSDYIRISGKSVGSPYKFMKFVMSSQTESLKIPYDMNYNHWIITPYKIGPAHILAYCNRFDDLNKALFFSPNEASFFSTKGNENPLSICVEMQFKNCIDICLKYLKSEYQGKKRKNQNPRAYIPLETCLTQLNIIDYPYISKLYDLIFININEAYLPRFCLHETIMPSLVLAGHLKIYPDEIIQKEFYSNTGRPIVFSQSNFRLEIDTGTNGSIEFLKSLLKCSDSSIFRSSIVQEYLNFKWAKVKSIVYLSGSIYIMYLFLLGIYIIFYIDSTFVLGILILFHLFFCLFQMYQISTDFTDYFYSIWNILDQLRCISFSFYAIMAMDKHYNNDILLAVLIFSWTEGINCFRMFDKTRYMVRLIIQVIIDITTFFFILFYATLAFAFIFYLRDPLNPFAMYLTVAYRLDLGDFETGITETFDWVIFFVSTMINPLIMLNLLIAIMSDTATSVAEIDDICGSQELAQIIIDVEKSTVKDIKVYSNKLVNTHIENGLSNVIDIQDKLKIEMKNKFETCKNLISNIDQKINVKYE